MTGAEILIDCLNAQRVDLVVGMPGTQNVPIYDAVLTRGGIRHILSRNEQGASLIANGFARASGNVGVAVTVPGPGSSNASTGILDGYTDSIPVLLITGGTETHFDGRDRSKCFHGLDQRSFFAPITRYYGRPTTISEIPEVVEGAFRALRAARPGPAVIELPSDIAAEEGAARIPPYVDRRRPPCDIPALERAARLVGSARRPVIVFGSNVLAAEATQELVSLVEQLRCPAIYTRLSKGGIPDDHPLRVDTLGSSLARAVIEESDIMLAVGCRFTQLDTYGWRYPLSEKVIQFDPDPNEIGREYPVTHGVVGDLKESLGRFLEAIGPHRGCLSSRLPKLREAHGQEPPYIPGVSGTREHLRRDAIVCVDVTCIGYRMVSEFPVYEPRTFHYPATSVTLGFGVPAAIGAKLAFPDRQVVAFCGDGGFQMTAYELATAAEHGIGIVVVVSNDGGLTAIRAVQSDRYQGRTIDTEMKTPHLAAMSEAMGARGIRVEDAEQVPALFAEALASGEPTVIEVMLEAKRDQIIELIPWLNRD